MIVSCYSIPVIGGGGGGTAMFNVDGENIMSKKMFASMILALGLCNVSKIAHADMATTLAGGGQHTCALTTAGGVLCWGYNGYGQLGNGGSVTSNVPVAVSGLSSGVVQIANGLYHSCAVLTNGSAKCWGHNATGQLGDGSGTTRTVPVTVSGLNGAIQIAAANGHTCAVTITGGVKCWGINTYGGVGDGTTTQRLTPVDVLGVSGAVAVAVGPYHSCALINTGQVKCWGANTSGELGNGSLTSSLTRVDVSGLNDANAIAAGLHHTCVKTTSGNSKCWGQNGAGQLGNGTISNATTPTLVSNLTGVVQISASVNSNSTCATVSDGSVKCWGLNGGGQLGTGDTANKLVPANTTGLAGAANFVVIGDTHGCARVSAGVQCWGNNANGQAGAGNNTTTSFPQNTVGLFGTAPVLTPVALSPVTSATPTYTWKAVPGATSYNLRVNGVTMIYSAAQANCPDGIGLCAVLGTALTPGAYSWQVQPVNAYGSGNWSTLLSFTL